MLEFDKEDITIFDTYYIPPHFQPRWNYSSDFVSSNVMLFARRDNFLEAKSIYGGGVVDN